MDGVLTCGSHDGVLTSGWVDRVLTRGWVQVNYIQLSEKYLLMVDNASMQVIPILAVEMAMAMTKRVR